MKSIAILSSVIALAGCHSGEAEVPSSPGLRGARLWVDSTSSVWRFYEQTTDATSRADLRRIAEQPIVPWFTEITPSAQQEVDHLVSRITSARRLPVFVLYAIPQRDCGAYAAGGAGSAEAYRAWIEDVATGIGDRAAVVLLEPDALMEVDCLSDAQRDERFDVLRDAVSTLKRNRATSVYLDAGNPAWEKPRVVAGRLKQAGIDRADGFTLNISNTIGLKQNQDYGRAISKLVGNKPFIIDTSRNGRGSGESQWCNPADAALGRAPTTKTGDRLIDAYLWVKTPGESDGECNGGPAAGKFWPQAALRLIRNTSP